MMRRSHVIAFGAVMAMLAVAAGLNCTAPPPQCTSDADCDDQDPCTADGCVAGVCGNLLIDHCQPNPRLCSTEDDCDGGEVCQDGECISIQRTECSGVAFACFDGLARQPADSILYRPISRWPRKFLTWRMANFLPNLSETQQGVTTGAAFAAWQGIANLRFQRVETDADITISFERAEHDDDFAFDGPGGFLAHAYFPSTSSAGQIHLDLDETWALEPGTDQVDLFTVLLHEIGHALGLDHSLLAAAAMAPDYVENERLELDQLDVDAIQRLYGSADGLVNPIADATRGNLPDPPDLTAQGDPDSDGDGIPDTLEVFVYGTEPLDVDSDNDGRSDFEELFVDGTLPTCPGVDGDGDGLPDACESIEGTDLNVADTDGDGLEDGVEVFFGTDPNEPDTDGDGCSDGEDVLPNVFTPDMRDCATCSSPEACGDGIFCNGPEACDSGRCEPGADPCPGQLCEEGSDTCVECLGDGDCSEPETCQAGVCVECSTDLECDDELFCNGTETCVSGSCMPGIAPCPAAACDESAGSCDCSVNSDCDDGLDCTDDSCDPASGCSFVSNCPSATPICTPGGCVECEIDDDCESGEVCTANVCIPAGPLLPVHVRGVNASAGVGGSGTSWTDAYKSLQDALGEAQGNSTITEIWVAAGTYEPDRGAAQSLGDRTATFQLVNAVAVLGGFAGTESDETQRDPVANEAILSGDLARNDAPVADPADLPTEPTRAENAFHVVTGSGTNTTAVLDGFTITGGNANGDPSQSEDLGGGMFNENGGPTLIGCKFQGNTAGVGPTSDCCVEHPSPGCDDPDCAFDICEIFDPTCCSDTWSSSCAEEALDFCEACSLTGGGGGGMYNSASSPMLVGCIFTGNTTIRRGGGMYAVNGSIAQLTDCTFGGNSAIGTFARGGAVAIENSNPEFLNCVFNGNSSDRGAGMYSSNGSSLTMTQCTFRNNAASFQGGAMYNEGTILTIIDSIFQGNSGFNGGGIFQNAGSLDATNCLFSGNQAANDGGGIAITAAGVGATVTLANSTFSGNSADQSGGGVIAVGNQTALTVANSIFWRNSDNEGLNMDESAQIFPGLAIVTVDFTVVQGGWSGAGVSNINADPLFINAVGADGIEGTEDDNLRLTSGSPCIDAGDNSAVPVGVAMDLDGNPRFVDAPGTPNTGPGNPPVDMGAYEFPG